MPLRARTHYEILGLDRNATGTEIRDAYRSLARQCHPDVCAGVDAKARFAELASAYEVLHDPHRRALYDAALDSARRPSGPGVGQACDLDWQRLRRDVPRFLDEEPAPANLRRFTTDPWRLVIFWQPAAGARREAAPAPDIDPRPSAARRARNQIRWLR